MTEHYAKITHVNKGMFRFMVVIYKSKPPIDSVLVTKKFFRYNGARQWAEKKIFKATMDSSVTVFIREQDLTRKVFK